MALGLLQKSSASSPEPRFVTVSHASIVRLLVAITAMMVVMNVVFLLPLDEWLVAREPHYSDMFLNHYGQGTKHNATLQLQSSGNNIRPPKQASSSSSSSFTVDFPKLTEEEGQQHIRDLFQEAGVPLTPEMEAQLPSWSQVQEVVGPHPYILGLDKCQEFRDTVPALERMLGSSGMFNTGTNLITHLLKQNCEIPERRQKMGPHQSKESYGMRWQVPWGKHTPAKYKNDHATEKAGAAGINKDYILPVVTIRNPYTWFVSMCHNGYTAKWPHGREIPRCPSLKDRKTQEWNQLSVKTADKREDFHKSLAHLWNDWYYHYLKDADYPYVVVRMEDMVFYPKETIKAVCECAGGEIRTDKENFTFIVDSAKADSPGHDKSTGIFNAWVKYGQRFKPRNGFTELDYEAAREALDEDLMTSLGYQHPPPE